MSAVLRSPAEETDRLIDAMLATHTEPHDGVLIGNADLATPAEWTPYTGPKERPTLPGREHTLPLYERTWKVVP